MQTAHTDRQDIRATPAPERHATKLGELASYIRTASRRRGLTGAELADDLADKLCAVADAEEPVEARPFLEALVASFEEPRHRIHVNCDPALTLPGAQLATFGVIASEAISNALKHAFPHGRDGDIWVRLAEERGRLALVVRDNGIGMPDTVGDRLSGRGLIETLAHQLGGYARLGSAPFGGALVTVALPHAH